MALFSRSKKGEAKTLAKSTAQTTVAPKSHADTIIRPQVTEKAVGQSGANVYTFVVKKDATKFDVRNAVKHLFQVTPVKVNIVNKQSAKRLSGSRSKMVHQAGMKKAYVYLKKGDSINFV